MSQFDWGVMDPNSKSGPQLALDLNDFRDALNTLHRGAARPPYAQAGMLWMKEVSSEQWDLCVYDGQDDLVLRSFNPATSELFKFSTADITDLDAALSTAVQKDAAGTTGAALIPAGTAAQRPATPQNGMVRYNNDIKDFEYRIDGAWVSRTTLTRALNEAPPVTIASASTVAIGAALANTINISGTVAIIGFDTIAAGVIRRLVFQGALTLTHNATSLILPSSSNINTAAGDVAEFISLGGGNWKCLYYSKSDGGPVSQTDPGFGKNLQDVTASRALATNYVNATGRPIFVTVRVVTTGGSGSGNRVAIQIDGGTEYYGAGTPGSGSNYSLSAVGIVPAGKTYRFNVNNATLVDCSELRT